MLPASASIGDGEMCEMPFEVFVHTLLDDAYGMVQKQTDRRLGSEEFDNRLVFAGVGLVLWIATGIGQRTTIEDVSTAIAA